MQQWLVHLTKYLCSSLDRTRPLLQGGGGISSTAHTCCSYGSQWECQAKYQAELSLREMFYSRKL